MRHLLLLLWIMFLGAVAAYDARAELLLIDHGVKASGLWCFPLDGNPKEYVYLPGQARLALDDAANPQFSFIRYVINTPGESESNSITRAAGGGVLHFLVLYETPEKQVRAAEAELRERRKDDEIVLRGPVVFSAGRYTLVSSILNSQTGEKRQQVLATGQAPVLEGNRIALSFDLDPEKASLLMESFKMSTPDVSLVFDLEFGGITDAYNAQLTIDWSEVRKSKTFEAGASVYFIGADVGLFFDELRRNNAIQLHSSGSDASMEALLNNVYAKLLELMFKPAAPERVPSDQRGGLTDALAALFGQKGALSSRNTTGFGAHVGYQLKDMRTEGKSVLNFDHRSMVQRHNYITFNIGDFHKRFGSNEDYFRLVNLADPAFEQREVRVAVDGALLPEFEHFINNVTVTLRKKHQNGSQTLRELVLDRGALGKGTELRMVYGYAGDIDRLDWLNYEYRTQWSFKEGGEYQTDWQSTSAPMINLFAPYERRSVQLLASREALQAQGVRVVIVQVEYPFFGKHNRKQVVFRTDRDDVDTPMFEITLPHNQFDYDYSMTWVLQDGKRRMGAGKDGTGVLFLDEVPEGS